MEDHNGSISVKSDEQGTEFTVWLPIDRSLQKGTADMKVGVVGAGFVGSTSAYALVMRGVGSEIVLVDKNRSRAEAEADDIFHAVPFAHRVRVTAGDYSDLTGSRVVIIGAGVNQRVGETRIELLTRNAVVFEEVIARVLENVPNALLLIVTNPVDIMTHLATRIAAEFEVPSSKVIGFRNDSRHGPFPGSLRATVRRRSSARACIRGGGTR